MRSFLRAWFVISVFANCSFDMFSTPAPVTKTPQHRKSAKRRFSGSPKNLRRTSSRKRIRTVSLSASATTNDCNELQITDNNNSHQTIPTTSSSSPCPSHHPPSTSNQHRTLLFAHAQFMKLPLPDELEKKALNHSESFAVLSGLEEYTPKSYFPYDLETYANEAMLSWSRQFRHQFDEDAYQKKLDKYLEEESAIGKFTQKWTGRIGKFTEKCKGSV